MRMARHCEFGEISKATKTHVDGSRSYHAEPSGTFYRYDAKAIGSGSEGAQAELVNEYHKYVSEFA